MAADVDGKTAGEHRYTTRRALLEKASIGTAAGLGVAAIAFPDVAEASTITGYINVKDPPYSAAGDGTGNDATAINNAITDAANPALYPQGAVVYIPPGTYAIGSRLVVKNKTFLKGAGQNESILKATTALTGSDPIVANFVTNGAPTTVADVVIEDLQLDGNKSQRSAQTASDLIWFLSPDSAPSLRVHLRRLYGHDSSGLGFELQSCSDSEIRNCEVANNHQDGIGFWFTSQRILIANNYIHDCGDDHIALDTEDLHTDVPGRAITDVTITGNVVSGGNSLGNGIRIAGAKRVAVTGNTVTHSWFAGIVLTSANSKGVDEVTVSGNVIKDAGVDNPSSGYGISIDNIDYPDAAADITRVVISDNVITTPKTSCLSIHQLKGGAKVSDVVIANNVMERPGVHGLTIDSLGTGSEVSDISIEGNSLIGAVDGGFGIICNSPAIPVKRLSITNNRVRDWNFEGISLSGSNHSYHSLIGNVVFDNGIRGNSGNGIDLQSIDSVMVVGNRCRGNKLAGLKIQGTVTDALIAANELSNNTGAGIDLSNTTGQNLVLGNNVVGNGGAGIQRTNLNASTFIFQNAGDDPPVARHLYGTYTGYDPPSVVTGRCATPAIALTINGAVVGDTVSIASTHSLPAGMFFVANVTAANTVTIQLANLSGSTQNVGSGDVKVDVWKH
jgi:Pectate lyase superfamily protein/Right handed beta helix region